MQNIIILLLFVIGFFASLTFADFISNALFNDQERNQKLSSITTFIIALLFIFAICCLLGGALVAIEILKTY